MIETPNDKNAASAKAAENRTQSVPLDFASQVKTIKEKAKVNLNHGSHGTRKGFHPISRRPSSPLFRAKAIGSFIEAGSDISFGILADSRNHRTLAHGVIAKRRQVYVNAKSGNVPHRSGKPGLDTYISRMGQASIAMMDALARRHGVPYELSLPCLLHVVSLSLRPLQTATSLVCILSGISRT